ncbi:MAG TPA: GGDEF domain-containing protein [Clostridia bacterium]|nr:GGDEF domain-containing protein [Clostridia bacterium]
MLLEKKWVHKVYIFIIFIMIGFFSLSLTLGMNQASLSQGVIKDLNKDWINKNSLSNDKVDLPEEISVGEDNPVVIEKNLNESFKEEQTLLIRSSLANVQVLLDNDEIYRSLRKRNSLLNRPLASTWHLVSLPRESNAKDLTLVYFSPFESMHGTLNPVLYGNRGDLVLYLIKENAFIVITDLMILFLGIILVMFSFNFSEQTRQSVFSIGLFSILLSFWMLSETKMLQFFTANEVIIGSLAYVSLSLVSIPLIIYIKSIINEENKIFDFFITAFIINTLLVITMQLLGIKEFFETMGITHLLISLLILYSFYISYKSIWKKKEKNLKYFTLGIFALTVFSALELIKFYVFGIQTVSLFVRIGAILFIGIIGYGSIKAYIDHMEKSYRSEVYKELAYKDSLTGAKNRMAFQKEIEYLFMNKYLLNELCFIIFDLNNLKKINDEFGHIYGDQGIIAAYNCIEEYFNSFGNCYRIGGDEFACLLKIEDEKVLEERLQEFKKAINEINSNFDFPFNIASGYAFYDSETDYSPKELIHRGDQEMYKEKYSQKHHRES